MAPVNLHLKGKAPFKGKNPKWNFTESRSALNRKKKTWNSENKVFQGSLQEGKGFAFQRRQKVQQDYKKLRQKEKWRMKDSEPKLEEEYPEHLRHLYMAEQQRLNEEEQLNKDRRRKGRSGDAGGEEEEKKSGLGSSVTESLEKSATCLDKGPQIESTGQNQFKKTKWKKMSSNQKMMEEYKQKKEERERKREEYLKDKEQREEALKRYKQKKMATYQLLKKKTKKGQPNLNLQMELLLQKIQDQRKKTTESVPAV